MIEMSYRDESKQRRATQVRIVMDFVMGLFYTGVGLLLLVTKSFVGVAVPAVVAYILGAMMTIGGAARFYRGLKAVMPQKNDNNTPASE